MAKPHIVAESDKLSETDYPTNTVETAANPVPQVDQEQLDAEEEEFRAMRRDLPGVKGASASGIVAISVGKAPAKNEFFRTNADFRPIVAMVDLEVGMERQFFAVTVAWWTGQSTCSPRNGQAVTPADLPLGESWLQDFEGVARPGERPDVLCLAARELRSGRTLRLWRDELGEQPPYRTDDGVL